MNATVTSIRCCQLDLPTHQQLHEVFPNLASVDLCVEGRFSWHGEPSDWHVHLQQLASSNGMLLNKLKHFSLAVRPVDLTASADIQAILELLTR
jgi:hypothetical protein